MKKGNYEIPKIYIIMKGEVELFLEIGTNKNITSLEGHKKIKTLGDN